MKRFETFIKGQRDTQLFCQSWQIENPKGVIALTHGLAEHSDCYHELATDFCNAGWNVFAWDLRGHGRSEGRRGYVEDFEDLIKDHKTFFNYVSQDQKKAKIVAFGHSLGGLISTVSLIRNTDLKPAALALSAPEFGINVQVSKLKETVGKWMAEVAPKITMWNEIRYSQLTRDPKRIKAYEKDPLRHDKISPRLYFGMLTAIQEVERNCDEIKLPVSLQLAGHDELVNSDIAMDIFKSFKNPKSQMHVYSDSYHEIFNDLDRERAIHDLKIFLNEV